MSRIDGVEAAKEEVRIVITNSSSSSSSSDLSPTTLTTPTDPWMLFLYALKAPATKEKYIQRLTKFLDFLGYQGTKEEKARAFAAQSRANHIYAFNSVLKFFQSKREQIDRKEMAIAGVTSTRGLTLIAFPGPIIFLFLGFWLIALGIVKSIITRRSVRTIFSK